MSAVDALLGLAALVALAWWWRAARGGQPVVHGLPENPLAPDLEPPPEEARPSRVARRLRAAGWPVSPPVYKGIVAVTAIAAGLAAAHAFNGMRSAGLVAAAMTVYILHSLLAEAAARRAARFEEKLIGAVDLMVSVLRAGENPTQALRSAGEVSPNVVRREFLNVVRRLDLGMPIQRALSRMVSYDSEGVRLFCCTLVAKWTTGGDLTPVLTSAARIMRERLQYRIHLKGQLAGAQVSSMLVAASPYILMAVYAWRMPEWLEKLFTHPLGSALLFSAICVQIVGFLWIQRIMRTDM